MVYCFVMPNLGAHDTLINAV